MVDFLADFVIGALGDRYLFKTWRRTLVTLGIAALVVAAIVWFYVYG